MQGHVSYGVQTRAKLRRMKTGQGCSCLEMEGGKRRAKKVERKGTQKEAETSNDDDVLNTNSNDNEEKPFFEEVYLNDGSGRVARQCRADVLCPMRGFNFFKRARLQEHLKVHGEYRTVPFLQTGRPKKGQERQRTGDVDPFLNQRLKRFYEKDRKMAFAKETHEDQQLDKAKHMWHDVLTDVDRAHFASKEAYITQFVQVQMAMYNAEYHLREQRTNARIARGYEKQRRKPKSKAELEEGLHAKMTSDPHIDLGGSMEASKKGPDMLEEATNSPPLRQEIPRRRDKLPIQCGMHKSGSTLASAILVPSPDTISGYADMSIFSYHRGFVEVTTRGDSPTKTTRLDGQRLESEGHTQFRSIISKLVARVDMPMLYGIANNAQACTNVMNLFGMWMENTAQMDLVGRSYFLDSLWFGYVENQGDDTKVESLFSHIDASDLTWIFFPIVKLNHWCLFAWFNPAHKKLSKLHAKKTTLLYMDSLHGVIDPFQCMPSLHRALQALSKTCTNLALSPQLATPLLEVEFKCVRTPQQPNGHDCGYYVMAYCMHLLQDEALKRLDLNKWLTENWFSHQDVCNLRKDLHMWIRNT